MASSTSAPSRPLSDAGHKRLSSFPSRQRRMGPAPLASFEDLSMDKTNSDNSSSPEERKVILSEISEDPSSAAAKEALNVPTSPRIRIEAASSSSQHESDSKESTPEKEHFTGYAKEEFCEEMADLKRSTDELDAEEDKARKKRAQKILEMEKRDENLKLSELIRKGSSSSVISDTLLPVTSAHSSRLSSLGSIGSPARRSPSPHKMLLETSFCGNKPIQHPSIDIEDPPISTTNLMNFAAEKLESIKSPVEAKPPDIFRSTSPVHTVAAEIPNAQIKAASVPRTVDQTKTPSRIPDPATKSLQRRQEQQRRQAEHHEYYQRYVEQTEVHEKKATPDVKAMKTFEDRRRREQERPTLSSLTPASERQSRLEMSQMGTSPRSPRSPRLGKKVPTPQVPELRDMPRTSPSSPASISTSALEHHGTRTSRSITPSSSPKSSRKYLNRKGSISEKDEAPALSRKGSLASIFRKSDSALSPVTPDSPASSSGRKSPFSQFLRNAENKFRSRSRSRSRSKSRDRDLEDDTHDRRKVLSIFMPSKKKKKDSDKTDTKKTVETEEPKSVDPINSVEFKFNLEGTYQSSTFGLIRQESEVSRAIKEPLRGNKKEDQQLTNISSSQPQEQTKTETAPLSNEVTKKGSITENFSEEVVKTLQAREEEIKKAEKVESSKVEVVQVLPKKLEKVEKVEKKISPPLKDKSTNHLEIQNDPDDSLSISESERGSEIEYYKKKEKAPSHVESPDNENKGLVSQDSFEDDELPFVPTTLPQERSVIPHIIPVRERIHKIKVTQSIDRPRSATPIQPSRLEAYKQSSQEMLDQDVDKLTISIKVPQPGAVKVLPTKKVPKVPKRQSSKSWEDFCSEGLKSPRQLRKQYKERQQSSKDASSSPPPPPPPPPPPNWRSPVKYAHSAPETPRPSSTPQSTPRSAPNTARTGTAPVQAPPKWINFDELPSVVLKPVRQIKTVPPKPQLPFQEKSRAIQQKQREKNTEESAVRENEKEVPKPAGTPKTDESDKESSEHSSEESEEEKRTSISSTEDLSTVRETIEKLKQTSSEDNFENSDLERLLAPVNECITKLSSITTETQAIESRRSPIPDNWEDFLLPPQPGRRSRLSSLGSDAGSISGIRSPSPSIMLLETSFCGNQPIDDPALEEPDVPIPIARKLSGISLGDLSPLTSRNERERAHSLHCGHFLMQPDRASILSDSSAEGGSLKGSDYDLCGGQRGHFAGQRNLNPFGMDLEVSSNRSSIVSQDQETPGHKFIIPEIRLSTKKEEKFVEERGKSLSMPLQIGKQDESDKESSEQSSEESEEEKRTSISSTEDLSTVRETIEMLKQTSSEDNLENSDLERLLAPVNECISKLSSITTETQAEEREERAESRRSPIPDNWEDFLLPPQPGRRSRLSSLGSDAGSISGIRSPSPSIMLVETSFCGNQPIEDP